MDRRLFPPGEGIRVYWDVGSQTPVSLQFGDLGHSRGSNKANVDHYFNDKGSETVASGGGNPLTGTSFDPIATSDARKQTDEENAPGAAVIQGDTVQPGHGYTLLGLPTVTATIATTGSDCGQLDSRLLDVGPEGKQMLVSRGAYGLDGPPSGRTTFQLNGNGLCFAPGHRPKLEPLGKDEPYLRPSTPPPFQVDISDVSVKLPTPETSQDGCTGQEGPSFGPAAFALPSPLGLRRVKSSRQRGAGLRAAEGGHDPAVSVESEGRRQSGDPVGVADGPVGVAQVRELPLRFLDEGARPDGAVDPVDADEPGSPVQPAGEGSELGRLALARPAPARPEVDQRRLPLQ